MKYPLLPALAVLLLPACSEKPAEPPPAIVPAPPPKTSPGSPGSKLRPPPPVAQTPANPAAPAPPPLSREDLNALNADYESLAAQIEQHKPAPDGSDTAFASMQETYKVLNARRSTLLTGRTLSDKREIAKTTAPAVQRIEQIIKKRLLEKVKTDALRGAEELQVPETDDKGVPHELLDPANDEPAVEPAPPPGGFAPPANPGTAPAPIPLPPQPVPVPQDPEPPVEPEPAPLPEDGQPQEPQP